MVSIVKRQKQIEIGLYSLSCILHCIGFARLWKTRISPTFDVAQRLYLLNLSIYEIIGSIFCVAMHVLEMAGKKSTSLYDRVSFYISDIFVSGGSFCYIALMTVITIDRFLMVFLNYRYLQVVTKRKTKIILCFLCGSLIIYSLVYILVPLDFRWSVYVLSLIHI